MDTGLISTLIDMISVYVFAVFFPDGMIVALFFGRNCFVRPKCLLKYESIEHW